MEETTTRLYNGDQVETSVTGDGDQVETSVTGDGDQVNVTGVVDQVETSVTGDGDQVSVTGENNAETSSDVLNQQARDGNNNLETKNSESINHNQNQNVHVNSSIHKDSHLELRIDESNSRTDTEDSKDLKQDPDHQLNNPHTKDLKQDLDHQLNNPHTKDLKQDPDHQLNNPHTKDRCPNHQKKNLEVYCVPCNKAICYQCFVCSHNGHLFKSLEDAGDRVVYWTDLKDKIKSVTDKISDLERYSKKLDQMFEEISELLKPIFQKVDDQVEKLISELKTCAENIKLEIKMWCDGQNRISSTTSQIETLKTNNEKVIKVLKATIENSKKVFKDGSINQSLTIPPEVEKNLVLASGKLVLPDIPTISCDDIWFQESGIDSENLTNQLGRLRINDKRIGGKVERNAGGKIEVAFNPNSVLNDKWTYSNEVDHKGCRWQVNLLRVGDKTMHVYLYRLKDIGNYRYNVTLLNFKDNKKSVCGAGEKMKPFVVNWQDLSNVRNGFLQNGMFTVRVDIEAVTMTGGVEDDDDVRDDVDDNYDGYDSYDSYGGYDGYDGYGGYGGEEE